MLFTWELAADRDDVRRTWSSLLNAFLHPAMERFLFNAEGRLREFRTRRPLLIFRNDGGSSRVAKSSAIKSYSSGPRGGLEGTRALAGRYGFAHVLMVDVGGTTTDVGVVSNGTVHVERRGTIQGVATAFELAAIASHGVGGSSVIQLQNGNIQVGPTSVGAAPGPAGFGLGGTEATITDVYLLTGLLDPRSYLDGTLKLEPERSREVIETNIARPGHLARRGPCAHGRCVSRAGRPNAARGATDCGHDHRCVRRRRTDDDLRGRPAGGHSTGHHSEHRSRVQRVRHRLFGHLAELRVPARRRCIARSSVGAMTSSGMSTKPPRMQIEVTVALHRADQDRYRRLEALPAKPIAGFPKDDERLSYGLVVDPVTRRFRPRQKGVRVQKPDGVLSMIAGYRGEFVQDPDLLCRGRRPVPRDHRREPPDSGRLTAGWRAGRCCCPGSECAAPGLRGKERPP